MNRELELMICTCIKQSVAGDSDEAVRGLAASAKTYTKKNGTYTFIKYCVYVAELLADSNIISRDIRKQCVIKVLESAGIEVTSEVDDMIEKAVDELNHYTHVFADEFLND